MERIIYQTTKKEILEEMLQSFHYCIGLPVQLLDENGVCLLIYGGMNSYCTSFQKFLKPGESCAAYHQKAVSRAREIGEPYTFICHSELTHIVFPLVADNTLLGSVLVGPFLMEEADMSMIVNIAKHYPLNTHDALELYEKAEDIAVLEPAKVTHVNRLLFHLFKNLLSSEAAKNIDTRNKYKQQNKINDAIQAYKHLDMPKTDHYPFDKEQLLMQKVRSGNIQEAKAVLNDLLGYVLFANGHSLQRIKTKSVELCSVLSRTVIAAGADAESIMARSEQFSEELYEIPDVETLCYNLQELVESFVSVLFPGDNSADNNVIQAAIDYMEQHYKEEITLTEVAEHVYLNPAYFSSIFKQSTGISFKEKLTNLRIEEARRMLVETNASIVSIALSCGFSNQSYFSKVFKAKTGFSPKSFRD